MKNNINIEKEVLKMLKKDIDKLIELLTELQNQEYWNDENLLNNSEINLDIFSCTDLLIDFLQKNYISNDTTVWKIK